MEIFQKNVLSFGNVKNFNPCEVCGIYSYNICGVCKASVRYFIHKGGQNIQNFVIYFHSYNSFGMAITDVDLIGNKKKD